MLGARDVVVDGRGEEPGIDVPCAQGVAVHVEAVPAYELGPAVHQRYGDGSWAPRPRPDGGCDEGQRRRRWSAERRYPCLTTYVVGRREAADSRRTCAWPLRYGTLA